MSPPRPLAATWLLVLALVVSPHRDVAGATVSDDDVHAVARQLRCVVCQNLSVADSPSEMAHQMRELIRTRLATGERPEQVLAYFVERYGEWVLLAPPARGLNLVLWLAPFGAVVGGLALVLSLVRRWRRQAGTGEPMPPATPPPMDPGERARLAAELERLSD